MVAMRDLEEGGHVSVLEDLFVDCVEDQAPRRRALRRGVAHDVLADMLAESHRLHSERQGQQGGAGDGIGVQRIDQSGMIIYLTLSSQSGGGKPASGCRNHPLAFSCAEVTRPS